MAAVGQFLTFNIVKLELLYQDQAVGYATGFLLKHENQWWLVSNWHVFSGREPASGQSRHPKGAVPDTIRFTVLFKDGDTIGTRAHQLPLGDALMGNATWVQHPKEGQDVDVGAIKVDKSIVGAAKDLLEPDAHDPDMFLDLGAELFVPGFPLGLSVAGVMPIWKRASLASSLEIGPGVNRTCLIDTATREGMSGAPCLATSNWKHYRMDRKTSKVTVIERPLSWRLIGVYSGRLLAEDNFGAQLGIVWRENLLFDVLKNAKMASVVLRSGVADPSIV